MDINGVLTKRGGRFKTWHRRHFELHNNTLSYYVYDGGPLKGEYIITADTTIEHSKLRKHCFCLVQKTGRTLFMFADNTADQELWMNALNRAIVRTRMQSNIIKRNDAIAARPRSSTTGLIDTDIRSQHMTMWEIHVTVIQARNLSAKGSNNTYAKVILDTQSSSTKVVKKELNPVWDETFSFVWSAEQRYVRVEVWDTDQSSSRDTFLGVVYLPVLSLACGKDDPRWYALGKRSSRSRVSGEIKILAISDKAPDENATKLLRELQQLPELQCAASIDGFCQAVIAGADTCDESVLAESCNILDDIKGRFPMQVPPVETEELEDIALRVTMKPVVDKSTHSSGLVSADGILVLTNYRLLFVSHARLAFATEDGAVMSSAVAELTMAVPIAQITRADLAIEQDPLQNSGVLYDSLCIRTNDSKVISFVFLGMELGVNEPPVSNAVNSKKDGLSKSIFGRQRSGRSASLDTPVQFMASTKKARRTSVLSNSTGTQHISYLEAQHSQEGPPSQRFCMRLQWKIINRNCVLHHMKHVHKRLLRAVSQGVGVRDSEGRQVGRIAISYRDYNDLATADGADDGVLTESYEPFTRDSADTENVGGEADITVRGLELWVRSLPSPVKHSFYRELCRGWDVYDPHAEFARMGVPDAVWRLSEVNANYEICPTYPSLVAVPTSIDDHCLSLASLFRSRGRFPALSWRHPLNYCSLTRSSQPLVGLGQNRSVYDEQFIRAINQASAICGPAETVNLTTNHRMLPGRKLPSRNAKQVTTNERGEVVHPLVIVDARPKINAQANQAAGKGYEIGKAYEDCRVIFMNIANIHAMRKSVDALEEACCNALGDDSNWLKSVDSSGWLQHISRVLMASARIVHCITKEAYSVLVHCSDGWDRTAQLTSLSMLMMDPYYRTFDGFQVLMEKEWFSFGHKFNDRLGWRDAGWGDDERSPVFHQFLDCVHQCIKQNPQIFEFNEEILLFIATHVLSGWFGNMFANCERERIDLRDSSLSIWTYIGLERSRFSNITFIPYEDVWVPSCSARNVVVWDGWFLKWHNAVSDIVWTRKNEDFSDLHEAPSEWMADSEVERCCHCDQRFDFIHRRHHCRACGQIFCESCVKNMRIVRTVSETNPVRVCFDCVLLIDEATQKANDDDEDESESRSHKESTTSLFDKLRLSRKSKFSIDNEKYEFDPSSSPQGREDSVKSVSTLTTLGTHRDSTDHRNSTRPSLISRVGIMIKSKSTSSLRTSAEVCEEEPSSDESSKMQVTTPRTDTVPVGSYPTERIAAVRLKDPIRHPVSPDQGIVQRTRPFSSGDVEDDAEDQENDEAATDFVEQENGVDADDDDDVDDVSMGSASTSSDKKVCFALEENSAIEPSVCYSEALDDKHRPASYHDSRNGRTVKSSARARSHSHTPQNARGGKGMHHEHHHKKKSSKSPPRAPVQRSQSNRYDAFTKPVNLSVGGRPRRGSGN